VLMMNCPIGSQREVLRVGSMGLRECWASES